MDFDSAEFLNKPLEEQIKELDSDILPKNYSGWQRNLKFFTERTYSYEDLANYQRIFDYFGDFTTSSDGGNDNDKW